MGGGENFAGFYFRTHVPSLKLFKSLGFEEWGTFPLVALLGGEGKDLEILGEEAIKVKKAYHGRDEEGCLLASYSVFLSVRV